jgi:hypothetical protein
MLQSAVKVVNDQLGLEGLTPSLLVYGSIPRPARNIPADTQLQRARAVENARNDVENAHAHSKVIYALKYRGPYGRERVDLENFNAEPRFLYTEMVRDGPDRNVSFPLMVTL